MFLTVSLVICSVAVSDRRRRRAFLISFIAVVGQESCGVLALMQFAERLFVVAQGEAGAAGGAGGEGVGAWLPVVSPARCAVVLGTAQLIASAFALYLVERVGRRVRYNTSTILK